MYAVVATGGKQYKVAVGDVINVEKLDAEIGDTVELPVLLINDGERTLVDSASLEGKTVKAEVLNQFKDKKVLVIKYRRRHRYHRTKGHRQNLTALRVVEIPA